MNTSDNPTGSNGPATPGEPGTAGDLAAFLHQAMPLAGLLGITPTAVAADGVRATLEWAPDRCTAGGVLHGGILMTLADTVGAWCALLNMAAGAHTTTVESKTNFFTAVRGGQVEALARPVHVGRTTVVVDTELRDTEGNLVARTTQTQLVVRD